MATSYYCGHLLLFLGKFKREREPIHSFVTFLEKPEYRIHTENTNRTAAKKDVFPA